ncbi:MAG: oxidoreductase [Actinomycetota bacterium]
MRAGDDAWREGEPRKRRQRRTPKAKTSKNDQRAVKDFAKSRRGVEAFVEPRTLDQQFSVVLVAHDGGWLRFTLPDDTWLRKFAQKRGLPIYDAGVMGYPRRMREYRRDEDQPGT